ncbi:unnamed protein product [Durusdinium trenchii]|uniref:Serine/threonine-protein phosphatase PGAM5, mitochondrial n=1 Tax=Durusdinium trenchii TaxID=1381693 RepID=A0ABP0PIW6_9DINO
MWRRGLVIPGQLRTWRASNLFARYASSESRGLASRRTAVVAVGCLAAVSAGAVYDLTSQWLSQKDDEEWIEDWEERLAEQQSSSGEFGAVSVLGMELRQENHKDVGTRHLVFVRHAQPGHGEPLSDVGLQQAELLAQRLSVQTSDAKYKVVFHSPAPEAKATAKILKQCFGKVKMKESSLLAEDVPMVPSPAPEALLQLSPEAVLNDLARAEGALRTHLWRPTGGPHSSVEAVRSS